MFFFASVQDLKTSLPEHSKSISGPVTSTPSPQWTENSLCHLLQDFVGCLILSLSMLNAVCLVGLFYCLIVSEVCGISMLVQPHLGLIRPPKSGSRSKTHSSRLSCRSRLVTVADADGILLEILRQKSANAAISPPFETQAAKLPVGVAETAVAGFATWTS